MKDKGQMSGIAKFVAGNPGCRCPDVITGTGIPKCAVTSALFKLIKRGAIRRTGQPKVYRYFPVTVKKTMAVKVEKPAEVYDYDRPNPLSAIFDQKLREARRCLPTSQS